MKVTTAPSNPPVLRRQHRSSSLSTGPRCHQHQARRPPYGTPLRPPAWALLHMGMGMGWGTRSSNPCLPSQTPRPPLAKQPQPPPQQQRQLLLLRRGDESGTPGLFRYKKEKRKTCSHRITATSLRAGERLQRRLVHCKILLRWWEVAGLRLRVGLRLCEGRRSCLGSRVFFIAYKYVRMDVYSKIKSTMS